MSDTAITIEDLSKVYRIGVAEEAPDSLWGLANALLRAPVRNFKRLRGLNTFNQKTYAEDAEDLLWALRDINFEVKRGEVLGIIGRNGAGKSTLLKILSRITEPTTGRITMRGRVSALLEVGTGFHPELSGRENIYLNGTILGMSKAEVRRKFDDIVEFSGVGKFLDTPVKRYSSGMKVRLAFAVAAHLEPDILIVDEVLAVGDFEFQRKCIGKMQDVATGEGRTVLFVSHNMGAVADLCGRCIQLVGGRMVAEGEPREVIAKYMETESTEQRVDLRDWSGDRRGEGPGRITSVATYDAAGNPCSMFSHGDPIRFLIELEGVRRRPLELRVAIRTSMSQVVLHYSTRDDKVDLNFDGDQAAVELGIPENILNDGRYYVTVALLAGAKRVEDRVPDCLSFEVNSTAEGSIRSRGLVRLAGQWTTMAPNGLLPR